MPIPSENSIVNKKDRGRELQTNRKPCASKFESHPYAPPVEAIRTSRHDSRWNPFTSHTRRSRHRRTIGPAAESSIF